MTKIPKHHRVDLVRVYAQQRYMKADGWDLIVDGCVSDAEIDQITATATTNRGVLVLMSRQLKSLTHEQQSSVHAGHRTLLTVKIDLTSPVKAELMAQYAKDQAREIELMSKIVGIYCGLSPENLYQDGEVGPRTAAATANKLYKELDAAFKELGREVSEDEAFAWENANPVRPFDVKVEGVVGKFSW